jgi:pimeloyl-ACP methyl ester carboxylesterase
MLCQLLLTAGVAIVLASSFGLRMVAIVPVALAMFYGIALLVTAVPLALSRPQERGRGPRRSARYVLSALCGEALVLDIDMVSMALEPYRASTTGRADRDGVRPRPVLLVHGFTCNRAVWRPLLKRLGAAGLGPLRAMSLEPILAGMETYVAALLRELEALRSLGAGEPVAVVAHSMGGLVARAALRRARPGLIGRIITIGAPHHGTSVACGFPWANARQMCPGSRWLEELNADQEGHLPVPMTTLYSLDDNLIAPATSARLEGARTHELRGLGHLALLRSTRVLDRVVSELLE